MNVVIQGLTLLAHHEVRDDITLRIYLEEREVKRRIFMGAIIWTGLAIYMVKM